jgi:hypothetical protein
LTSVAPLDVEPVVTVPERRVPRLATKPNLPDRGRGAVSPSRLHA